MVWRGRQPWAWVFRAWVGDCAGRVPSGGRGVGLRACEGGGGLEGGSCGVGFGGLRVLSVVCVKLAVGARGSLLSWF